MKRVLLVTALLGFGAVAHAADPSCTIRATEKKLAGAAKTSFMKKCSDDAKSACEGAATERKLAGAARNSFVKKCVGDAVGG